MKKQKIRYYVVIIIISVIVSGCNPSYISDNVTENKNKIIEKYKVKQDIKEEDGEKLTETLKKLNVYLNEIDKAQLTVDERIEITTKFINGLESLLEMKQSIYLSDNEIEKALNNSIISKTKLINKNGKKIKVRLIRYDGLSELYGSLERVWNFIQWEDGNKVNVQLLIEQGAEIGDDLLIIQDKTDQTFLLLSGYLTVYKPNPVFIATWQLKDSRWKPVENINPLTKTDDIWSFNSYRNELTIESISREVIIVKVNEENNSFIVHFQDKPSKQVEFKMQDNRFLKIDKNRNMLM